MMLSINIYLSFKVLLKRVSNYYIAYNPRFSMDLPLHDVIAVNPNYSFLREKLL